MILQGNCLDVLPTLAADSVDSIVTDPPYHLTQPGSGGPHGKGLDTPYARAQAGASAEGFRFIGIELNPDYAAIAEARIRAVQPGLSLEIPA